MDDEIEDLVGDVKYTDSSKSMSTSIVYSYDFSDSSPERQDSSGKETYLIDYDETDSEDTEKTYKLQLNRAYTNMLTPRLHNNKQNVDFEIQLEDPQLISRYENGNSQNGILVDQEISTQTSKTIFELAESCGLIHKKNETDNLQTQTSLISITENKSVQYTFEVKNSTSNITKILELRNENKNCFSIHSDTRNRSTGRDCTESIHNGRIIQIFDTASSEIKILDDNSDKMCDDADNCNILLNNTGDKEEISKDLEGTETYFDRYDNYTTMHFDSDVECIYKKVLANMNVQTEHEECFHADKRKYAVLSPVTEESNKSVIDITPHDMFVGNKADSPQGNNLLTDRCMGERATDILKLPPISRNLSCPNSPHLSMMFASRNTDRPLSKSGTLPCLYNQCANKYVMKVDMETNPLASGENPDITGVCGQLDANREVHLPPIHYNDYPSNAISTRPHRHMTRPCCGNNDGDDFPSDAICIEDKIRELKLANKRRSYTRETTRSPSPASSPGGEMVDRSCESLCGDILKKLRSSSWFEVVEVLENMSTLLDRFWDIMSENRIADLLRQVTSHVESPRTQVARCACSAIAVILQNTNYVKKPDFYESMSALLNKTGSFSRPVRRAANVALDAIMCGVELPHAVTAVCVHGTSHKSGLVRSATARLLVVGAALAGGGRSLLRTRPTSAVTARQHLMKALSMLLEDKNNETRKFAERLYGMLRPLQNFDAYFLNDVDIEVASRQMKKFDLSTMLEVTRESKR